MGSITLQRLPEFFDKWNVSYSLEPGWETRGRGSGGFDSFKGVVVHHTATPATAILANSVHYALTGKDNPIANGVISRSKDGPKVVLWAGLAANHAGLGGPVLTSRGVVAKDNANCVMFGFEAENNGIGEPWDDNMCDLYIKAVVAVLDWGTNCTPGVPLNAGDVIAHKEWTPGRKIDPAGPSRFSNGQMIWNMDAFRGEIFALMLKGKPTQIGENTAMYRVFTKDDAQGLGEWLLTANGLSHSGGPVSLMFDEGKMPALYGDKEQMRNLFSQFNQEIPKEFQ